MEFTSFPRLPSELREMIWEMAIDGSPLPRIHHYSLFNTDDNGVRQSSLCREVLPLPIDKEHRPYWCLFPWWTRWRRPPYAIYSHKESYRWAKSNRFRHIWDAGLRTTCRESRRIILRHQEKKNSRFPTPDIAVARHNDENIQLGVNSTKEILCLEFSPEDLEACKTLRWSQWSVLLSRIPFFSRPRTIQVNVAFEFDKTWETGLPKTIFELMEEPSVRGLVTRLFWAWNHRELPKNTIIWLIDRGWEATPNYHNYYKRPENRPRQQALVFMDEKDLFIECFYWRPGIGKIPRSSLTFTNKILKWHAEYFRQLPVMATMDWPGTWEEVIRTLRVRSRRRPKRDIKISET